MDNLIFFYIIEDIINYVYICSVITTFFFKMYQLKYFLLLSNILIFFHAEAKDSTPEEITWKNELKEEFFAGEEILNGEHLFSLVTPYRAEDAAIVPISVKFFNSQEHKIFVEKLHLIVDENPAPYVANFNMSKKTGNAEISTRVRIDKYTYVRAVAQYSNGKKYMVSNFVKASGGCSAPSLGDMDNVMARLGKMKMKFINTGAIGDLSKAQFIISHPNFSGLQFNQLTRSEIPAHFVETVKISQDEDIILSVNADISLSEDPSFTFFYRNSGGPINVEVIDSEGTIFSNDWSL